MMKMVMFFQCKSKVYFTAQYISVLQTDSEVKSLVSLHQIKILLHHLHDILSLHILLKCVPLTRTAGRGFKQKQRVTSLGANLSNSSISRHRTTETTTSETQTQHWTQIHQTQCVFSISACNLLLSVLSHQILLLGPNQILITPHFPLLQFTLYFWANIFTECLHQCENQQQLFTTVNR